MSMQRRQEFDAPSPVDGAHRRARRNAAACQTRSPSSGSKLPAKRERETFGSRSAHVYAVPNNDPVTTCGKYSTFVLADAQTGTGTSVPTKFVLSDEIMPTSGVLARTYVPEFPRSDVPSGPRCDFTAISDKLRFNIGRKRMGRGMHAFLYEALPFGRYRSRACRPGAISLVRSAKSEHVCTQSSARERSVGRVVPPAQSWPNTRTRARSRCR